MEDAMTTPTNTDNYLSKEQIERIYEIYEFANDEEIEAAWYENGQLYIDYNSPSGGAIYEPSMDDEGDKEKIRYILTGDTSDGKI